MVRREWRAAEQLKLEHRLRCHIKTLVPWDLRLLDTDPRKAPSAGSRSRPPVRDSLRKRRQRPKLAHLPEAWSALTRVEAFCQLRARTDLRDNEVTIGRVDGLLAR
jgi:hypothetical protein